MRPRFRTGLALAAWLGGVAAPGAAQAHLMVAQRGTLNLQGDGGFLVLSLPVSALQGVDDDGDGRLSFAELKAHQADIEAAVRRGVQLRDASGPLPLQGLMLQLSPPEDRPADPADQLVAMGRYRLPADAAQVQGLRWSVALFGRQRDERQFSLQATRGRQAQTLLLTPGQSEAAVLPRPLGAAAGPGARALVPALLALAAAVASWQGWHMLRRLRRLRRLRHQRLRSRASPGLQPLGSRSSS